MALPTTGLTTAPTTVQTTVMTTVSSTTVSTAKNIETTLHEKTPEETTFERIKTTTAEALTVLPLNITESIPTVVTTEVIITTTKETLYQADFIPINVTMGNEVTTIDDHSGDKINFNQLPTDDMLQVVSPEVVKPEMIDEPELRGEKPSPIATESDKDPNCRKLYLN